MEVNILKKLIINTSILSDADNIFSAHGRDKNTRYKDPRPTNFTYSKDDIEKALELYLEGLYTGVKQKDLDHRLYDVKQKVRQSISEVENLMDRLNDYYNILQLMHSNDYKNLGAFLSRLESISWKTP